ncbi:protein zinc induced facilitator-like 1 [Phtheirospermum japonicum]|uniref:Protein zinc induced facilitator-like 1 n=1 Tax=Phtheirospermum japonicum TaxID=374723 RepID=A0A830C710_9LAMI|nr:protein zinc induced facilitator-like 1 [Phtheirospermum japonicum]
MAEYAESLLVQKNGYVEGCPGCLIDLRKQTQRGLPINQVLTIRDFHITEQEEDIGYYSGFIGASYMLGRALTSVVWGAIADKYGRKPYCTLFGFSVNFWMAVTTRFLLGSFNGLLGPIKAYACETVREEHQSVGLSAVSTAWGTGLIIGPALGGYLAQIPIPPTLFGNFALCGLRYNCLFQDPATSKEYAIFTATSTSCKIAPRTGRISSPLRPSDA